MDNNKLSNLERLLQSDSIILKEKEMPHPYTIINNFIGEPLVSLGKEHKHKLDNGNTSVSYNSYLITKEIEGYNIPEIEGIANSFHTAKLGVLVNLVQNKIKVFAGFEASACLNMCIFNADTILETNVGGIAFLSDNINRVEDLMYAKSNSIKETVERLINTTYNNDDYLRRVGQIYLGIEDNGLLVSSKKLHNDKENIYYDMPKSDWKLYSTLTDNIKNKPVHNVLKLTQGIEKLFV